MVGPDTRIGEAEALFRATFGGAPEAVGDAPGRVNLIGEHVDYHQGPVVPMALARGTAVALAPRDDGVLAVVSARFGAETRVPIDANPRELRGPLRYVGAARAVTIGDAEEEDGGGGGRDLRKGLAVAIAGDLPVGAGLSSSASLLVALLAAFDARVGRDVRADRDPRAHPATGTDVRARIARARRAHRAETAFVGVNCGVMDHYACALCAPGTALFLDCRDLAHETLALGGAGASVLVVDSGTRRNLADSAYNARVAESRAAFEALRARAPDLRSLRDASLEQLGRAGLDEPQDRRARHVIEEIARVSAFRAALERGDAERMGALLDASHVSLRDLYEVSTPALDVLVDEVRAVPGVLGARLTGAGFGGAIVALARPGTAADVVERALPRVRERAGLTAVLHEEFAP